MFLLFLMQSMVHGLAGPTGAHAAKTVVKESYPGVELVTIQLQCLQAYIVQEIVQKKQIAQKSYHAEVRVKNPLVFLFL